MGSREVKPLLSIVIANYNFGQFLEEAIRSVLAQTADDEVELIVVDGGSTDNSVEVITRYADRISWWCSEPDGGQSVAFNKGFTHAHGEFLTWLNADDVMLPGAVAALRKSAARHSDCPWFIGGTVWCDKNWFVLKIFKDHRFSRMRLLGRSLSVGGPSSFFTKELFVRAGGFDETLHYVMDSDLWYRMALKCGEKYIRMNHPTWAFRFHERSKTSGRISNPKSNVAQRNEEKFANERHLLRLRYGRPSRFATLLCKFPVSVTDTVRAFIGNCRFKKHHLNEFCGAHVVKSSVLLSNSIQEYFTGLRHVSNEVYAFNTWRRKKFEDKGSLRFLDAEMIKDACVCARIVEERGIGVLYAQGARSLIDFYLIKRRCKRIVPRLLVNCHSPSLWGSFLKSFVFVLASCFLADAMIFLVEGYRLRWLWLTRLFRLKTYHVPNPVDLMRFVGDAKEFVGRPLTIVNVGVVSSRKRQDMLVLLAGELRRRGLDVNVKLAGDTPDKAYLNHLNDLIVKNDLVGQVEIPGCVPYDEVPGWLRAADIYICPSDAEVMPFSILEAMASALPIVAHDIAGHHEQVVDGENGFLVRSQDVAEYADAVEKILADYERFSRASRKRAEEVFAMNHYAEAMREIL